MTRTLEKVYSDLSDRRVDVFYCPLGCNVSIASADGYIGVDVDRLDTSAKVCDVMMHESGHFISGAFYNPDASYDIRSRAEYRADKAAFLRYIPYAELARVLTDDCTACAVAAEHFGVSLKTVEKAYYFYKNVQGRSFAF